mmetsp:Transcript_40651/g.94924  ORF Transcript_40651/g.94924 Transcript_40651/m.94924 type:complete len:286 (+) Transcript_40651:140-997(+)
MRNRAGPSGSRAVVKSLQPSRVLGGAQRGRLLRARQAKRCFAKGVVQELHHSRQSRRAAEEEHLVNVSLAQACAIERCGTDAHRRLECGLDERLGARARERQLEVLGPVHVSRDEGQRHVRRVRGAQLRLCVLNRLVQPVKREVVAAQIDRVRLPKPLHQVCHERLVDSLAANGLLPRRAHHLPACAALVLATGSPLKDRERRSAPSQLEDGDGRRGGDARQLLLSSEHPRDGRSEKLELVQTCSSRRVEHRLAERVGGVGGDGEHRREDRPPAERPLRIGLQLM